MFRSALFNTEAIRRKGKAEEGKEKKEEEDHKTAKAKQGVNGKPKGIITSSAEPDRKPDGEFYDHFPVLHWVIKRLHH